MTKTALITGAAKRIGKSLALHLASQGWNIALHYHSSENEAQKIRTALAERYPDQHFELFPANLEATGAVQNLVPEVLKTMKSIDLLINNASVFEPATITETSVELLLRQMAVNFTTPFLLISDYARLCKNGVVVNFVDTRIVSNQESHAAYTISKKALWELTKMAALEFGPRIRVNAIAPGLTLPPEDKDDGYLLGLAGKIAMQRPGGIEPILKSLDFILGNDYLTGQLLFCDGGENLGSKTIKQH